MAQSAGASSANNRKFRFCNLDPWKPEAVAVETDFQPRLEINRRGGRFPSRQSNSVSLLCFDLVPISRTFLLDQSARISFVQEESFCSRNERSFFFDNYSLDLFKVTVCDGKEKKLRENSRILLIFNWKKNIRIIIEIIIVGFLNKYYLF